MMNPAIIAWLLAGDVSIQYQTHRDLLHAERPDLRRRIATEGWGAAYLSRRHTDGSWGGGFYQPKWISTHYTLLDSRNLAIAPDQPQLRESVIHVLTHHKDAGGGINLSRNRADLNLCPSTVTQRGSVASWPTGTSLHPCPPPAVRRARW